MKLSILILTHNRPKLFKRCIKSVLANIPDFPVEIIVNNDSNDITEIYSDVVTVSYHYKKHKMLTDTYKFLYNKSQGDFIFYLEDDDYIKPDFFKFLDFNYDINFINYISEDVLSKAKNKELYYKRFFTKNKHLKNNNDLKMFIQQYNPTDFQFSQIVFKKEGIKYWPTEDNIHNDYKIFRSLDLDTIMYISKPLWVQTTDGKDNISFEQFNIDARFK